MAIRGYEVQAFDFILKPVNYFSFSMKIKNLANLVNSRKTKKIIITTENGMRRITTDELRYVEVNGHYLYYHTGNKKENDNERCRKRTGAIFVLQMQ